MHILIAPNAFKNSLDAASAAKAIEQGLQQSELVCTTECFPVGDGGDGTGTLITEKRKGKFVTAEVHDALGRKINAVFGLIDEGKTAVIEMAAASGIHLLNKEELDPLHASSFGTGELMLHALDSGVKKILLCVGGSATVDAGVGILQALGVRFLDANGKLLLNMPESLHELSSIDRSDLDQRITNCECIILCDVANPLLGDNGAAKIFGPQKGASYKQVQQLENSLTQFSKVVLQGSGIDIAMLKHGGAAGGVAAGLNAFLNAKLVNGIDHFLDITGFDSSMKKTSIVITGEGSIDLQTLEGKGPYGVAMRAKKKEIPVIALAGRVPATRHEELDACFDLLLSINHESESVESEMKSVLAHTAANLTRSGTQLGNLLASA